MKEIKHFFKFGFDFVGVASRKEFWIAFSFVLCVEALTWGLALLGTFFQLVAILVFLGLIIPSISIMVRRLHDTDKSALYMLWLLAPFVGVVVLLIIATEKTKYFIK